VGDVDKGKERGKGVRHLKNSRNQEKDRLGKRRRQAIIEED